MRFLQDLVHESCTSTASRQAVGLWGYRFQLLTRYIVDYKYVDETADIARHYSADWSRHACSPLASERRRGETSVGPRDLVEPSILSDTIGSHPFEQVLPPHRPASGTLTSYSPYHLNLSPGSQSNHSSLHLPRRTTHIAAKCLQIRDT